MDKLNLQQCSDSRCTTSKQIYINR